jgi:predicted site-specific integrase-resolvase
MTDRELFDPTDAANYLGLAVQTLSRWRVEGGGPPFLKLGSRIRYMRSDLEAFCNARKRKSTSESAASSEAIEQKLQKRVRTQRS